MTEAEARAWGRIEAETRMADVRTLNAGLITVALVNKGARERMLKSSMTRREAYYWYLQAAKEIRRETK